MPRSCINNKYMRLVGTILLSMAIFSTSANAELSVSTWVSDWINENINGIPSNEGHEGNAATWKADAQNMLVNASEVTNNDIVLDVSENAASYIKDAIHISSKDLVDNNNSTYLPAPEEIARIFGEAGITRNDPLVVYGECRPCGGGPSAATYVYWQLRYVGHENVLLLDGGIDAWEKAGLPVQNASSTRKAASYVPALRPELFATYDYVKSGSAQIVDARTAMEFESGSIPGAINIPYSEVLKDKKIKNKAELEEVFVNLTKEKPVVVFTMTGSKASMVWFTLTMMGYEAKLYTWKDWTKNRRATPEKAQKA